MVKNMKFMLIINLHELDFLEETLTLLSEEFVRDCVVYDAEGIVSRHGKEKPIFGFLTSGFSINSQPDRRNQNYIILAIVKETAKEKITTRLQTLHKDTRWAASFWFVQIEDYFYHKGTID